MSAIVFPVFFLEICLNLAPCATKNFTKISLIQNSCKARFTLSDGNGWFTEKICQVDIFVNFCALLCIRIGYVEDSVATIQRGYSKVTKNEYRST